MIHHKTCFIGDPQFTFADLSPIAEEACRMLALRGLWSGIFDKYIIIGEENRVYLEYVSYLYGVENFAERVIFFPTFQDFLDGLEFTLLYLRQNCGITAVTSFIANTFVGDIASRLGLEYHATDPNLVVQMGKWFFKELCDSVEVPTPKTYLLPAGHIFQVSSDVFCKPDFGAGGMNMYRVKAGQTAGPFPVDYVVQEDLSLRLFSTPSIQWEIKNSRVTIGNVTEQLTREGSFIGCVIPPQNLPPKVIKKMEKYARLICEGLVSQYGVTISVGSIDFFVLDEGTVLAGEMNIRRGGVTPPNTLMERFWHKISTSYGYIPIPSHLVGQDKEATTANVLRDIGGICQDVILYVPPFVYGDGYRVGLYFGGETYQECVQNLNVILQRWYPNNWEQILEYIFGD
jgi:hypothetical protein